MSISRWDPFKNVNTLQDRINRLFEDAFPKDRESEEDLSLCSWRPTVDIIETENSLIIKADLPGVSREDISVELKDNILFLKGERKSSIEMSNKKYLRQERCRGSFHRAFTLHHSLTPDSIKASFKDGVLEIAISKPEEEEPKKISVNID